MSKVVKIIIGIIIFSMAEYLSILFFKSVDMGSIFALWGILFLLLLINSIFGLFGNSYNKGHIIGGTIKGSPMGHVVKEPTSSPKKTSGLFKTINFVYVILIIANVIGYMLIIN